MKKYYLSIILGIATILFLLIGFELFGAAGIYIAKDNPIIGIFIVGIGLVIFFLLVYLAEKFS